jgi:hypothetical protein
MLTLTTNHLAATNTALPAGLLLSAGGCAGGYRLCCFV